MKLTKKGFVAWLKSKPKKKIVGRRGECEHCPIATYILEKEKVDWVQVFTDRYKYCRDDLVFNCPMPKWGGDFVFAIDEQDGHGITAGKALATIEQLNGK